MTDKAAKQPDEVKRNSDGSIHAYVRIPLREGILSTGMGWMDLKPGDKDYDYYDKWLKSQKVVGARDEQAKRTDKKTQLLEEAKKVAAKRADGKSK